MKKLSVALVLLLVSTPLAARVPPIGKQDRKVMVMAHRGCWEGGAPEVSVAAIRACDMIGPDTIEIDVQMTRDRHLVLMHDETVDRMTDGQGNIAEKTVAAVRALRLRAGEGGPTAPLTSEHIPTLEQGLRAAKGKFHVNLHLKLPVENEVADVVKKLGMTGQVTTWVSGKADDDRLVHSPMQGIIGLIPIIHECTDPATTPCRSSPMTDYAPYRPAGFYLIPSTDIASLSAEKFLKEATGRERPFGSWIMASTLVRVDMLPRTQRREIWQRLIGLGVNLIMTDHPADLIDLLNENTKQK